MAQQLADMMGLPLDQAQFMLDAAGGDLETACALALSDGGGGVGAFGAGGNGGGGGFNAPFDWYNVVWPQSEPIPESWMGQTLDFMADTNTRALIPQPKNGPCGVLAAVQAVLLSNISGPRSPQYQFNDNEIVTALASLLAHAKGEVKVAHWEGPPGGNIQTETCNCSSSDEELKKVLVKYLPEYKAGGGLCLLLYSAILTRGIDQAKRDVTASGGELPLIYGPYWFCTTEAMCLLLCGVADGNMGAYGIDGEKRDVKGMLPVGLLSFQERQTKIPVADSLKGPPRNVWIIHGGDHFTVLWAEDDANLAAKGTFDIYHFNGLPPGGPRLVKFAVKATKGERPPAPEIRGPENLEIKPEIGEIDDIVQAHPDDKKNLPHEWNQWRYEIVLVKQLDPKVQYVERPSDVPPQPIFPQGDMKEGPWRCTTCYAGRFETMCFGLNDAGAAKCQHCGQNRADCGWSIWMKYDELPDKAKGLVVPSFAPKVLSILQTKWPLCEVNFGGAPPPSV